ncbi:MAG TPA: hypothetical protein VKP10_03420 [Gemmatimonadales bacterium]|nr:hypothetical protein [Gemmatimonadales bacterium]
MINAMKALGITLPALLVTGIVAAVSSDNDPDERTATIPAGATLVAVLADPLSTARSQPGDEVELRTVEPLHVRGADDIPAGIVIHGTVLEAAAGDQAAESPGISVRFNEMEIDGDEHAIATEEYRFGTLVERATNRHLLLPAGERMNIRLTRPVTVEYHLAARAQSAE